MYQEECTKYQVQCTKYREACLRKAGKSQRAVRFLCACLPQAGLSVFAREIRRGGQAGFARKLVLGSWTIFSQDSVYKIRDLFGSFVIEIDPVGLQIFPPDDPPDHLPPFTPGDSRGLLSSRIPEDYMEHVIPIVLLSIVGDLQTLCGAMAFYK